MIEENNMMEENNEVGINVGPLINFMDNLNETSIRKIVDRLSFFSVSLIDSECKNRKCLEGNLDEIAQNGEDISDEDLILALSDLEILNPSELSVFINGVSGRTFKGLDSAVSERIETELEIADEVIDKPAVYKHSLYN